MEENQSVHTTQQAVPGNNGKRNLGVIISFVVVLLVVTVVVIARLYPHARQNGMQSLGPTKAPVPVANMMYIKSTPTPNMDTSNTQLDQDVQNAQSSLNGVDTDLNNASQAINNQSADTPQ